MESDGAVDVAQPIELILDPYPVVGHCTVDVGLGGREIGQRAAQAEAQAAGLPDLLRPTAQDLQGVADVG